jgi:leucine dehydrogenase
MDITKLNVEGYEEIVEFRHGPHYAIIAVHSTKLGPAIGGCRVFPYKSSAEALVDALALAKGMTLKNAAVGLNYGGAKMVITADKSSVENMLFAGECIEYFKGRYISAEDVGTTVENLRIASQNTSHISLSGGDPSLWTALGVYKCISTAVKYMGETLNPEYQVWVQGLGKVGWCLCEHLYMSNIPFCVSDIKQELVEKAIQTFPVMEWDIQTATTEYKPFLSQFVGVYAPCAMGQVITKENVDSIKFPIICGSANNQLADDSLSIILKDRGVLYCPDFIVNAGGVLNVAAGIDTGCYNEMTLYDKILGDIPRTLLSILEISDKTNSTPLEVAKNLAYRRIQNDSR